eukprot:357018-Chlamydomonas_euryale.AAC.1
MVHGQGRGGVERAPRGAVGVGVGSGTRRGAHECACGCGALGWCSMTHITAWVRSGAHHRMGAQ